MKKTKIVLAVLVIAVVAIGIYALLRSKVGADVVFTGTEIQDIDLNVGGVVDLTSKLPSNYWDVSQGSSAQCIADELSNDNKIVTAGYVQPPEKKFGFGVFSVKNNTLSQIMPKDNQQLVNQYYGVRSITNSRDSKDIYMGGSTDSLNNIALFNKVIFNTTTGSSPENNAYSLEDILKYASNGMKFAPSILMNDGSRYIYLVGNAGLPGSTFDAKKIKILLYDPDYKNWVDLSDESYSENINSFLQPIIAKYDGIDTVTPRVGAWDTVNNYGLVGFELSSSKGGQGVEIIVKIKGNSGAPFEDITGQFNKYLGATSTSFSDMTFNKDRKEIAILFGYINPLVYDGNVVKSMTQDDIRSGNYIMTAGELGSDWLIGGETFIGDRKAVLYQIKSNGVVVDLSKQVEDLDNTQYSKSPSCISSWYNKTKNDYETLILTSNRKIKLMYFAPSE